MNKRVYGFVASCAFFDYTNMPAFINDLQFCIWISGSQSGTEDEKELDELINDIKKMDIDSLQLDPFERKLLSDFIKVSI